jgi:CRP/FNR family transcriptional regulator, anaerobic regulatory protein
MNSSHCQTCSNNICARKVPLFASLSQDDILKVIEMIGHIEYKKGEFLFREGDASAKLFIVNQGKVKLSKLNKEGKEQILRIVSEGSFFGEYYVFSDYEPYNFSAIALSDVKICTLTKSHMDGLLQKHPEMNYKILSELSKKLIQTENLVQNLSSIDTTAKVAYVLLELASKHGVAQGQVVRINMPINREEMANYAGVTRETMSRKLNQFVKEGIIETVGNKVIIVKELAQLKDFI